MTYSVQGVKKTALHGYEVERIGEYARLEDAIEAAMTVINAFLLGQYTKGMSAEILFQKYKHIGQVPMIFGEPGMTMEIARFNHFEYAMSRCKEMTRDE